MNLDYQCNRISLINRDEEIIEREHSYYFILWLTDKLYDLVNTTLASTLSKISISVRIQRDYTMYRNICFAIQFFSIREGNVTIYFSLILSIEIIYLKMPTWSRERGYTK